MNETSVLVANLVQTKSIQRVLAPIAAGVSSHGIIAQLLSSLKTR